MSYLPTAGLAPERAVGGIIGDVRVVGGFANGAQTFVPGESFSDLTMMDYGKGYWIYSRRAAYLNYRGGVVPPPAARVARAADSPVMPTSQWMDIYGSISLNGRSAAESTIVSLVDGDGVVCGQALVRRDGTYGFLHVYGDDPATDTDEGAVSGEALHVQIGGVPVTGAPGSCGRPIRVCSASTWTCGWWPTSVDLGRALQFALESARPNPFNPTTAIGYELAAGGDTRIVVYNNLGQHCAHARGSLPRAGPLRGRVERQGRPGRDSASGVYVIRLIAGEGTLTTRAVLAR